MDRKEFLASIGVSTLSLAVLACAGCSKSSDCFWLAAFKYAGIALRPLCAFTGFKFGYCYAEFKV